MVINIRQTKAPIKPEPRLLHTARMGGTGGYTMLHVSPLVKAYINSINTVDHIHSAREDG